MSLQWRHLTEPGLFLDPRSRFDQVVLSTEVVGEIEAASELSPARLAELTSRFVAVPSVNGEHPERDLAQVIDAELSAVGYRTVFVGSDSRPSLAAIGEGSSKVLLNGHLDTVPVDDGDLWRYEPFGGFLADGAVHGRGACDMKGGLAIEVAVAQWLASRSGTSGLVLHFAMGEERGEPGTESLVEAGFVAPQAMVLEPTDLRLGIAQRGLMTIRIIIGGRAGHASRPDLTTNPIERLPAVLGLIEKLQDDPGSSHPLLGDPQWTTTVVHSGIIPSMVPGLVEVLVDRRMLPGESNDAVLASVEQAVVETLPDDDVTVSVAEEEGVYEPAEIPPDTATVQQMTQALELFGEAKAPFGTPYSSDVRHLINTARSDAVTFGPGRFSEMHARDEFIRIDDLVRGARVVAAFCVLVLTQGG